MELTPGNLYQLTQDLLFVFRAPNPWNDGVEYGDTVLLKKNTAIMFLRTREGEYSNPWVSSFRYDFLGPNGKIIWSYMTHIEKNPSGFLKEIAK